MQPDSRSRIDSQVDPRASASHGRSLHALRLWKSALLLLGAGCASPLERSERLELLGALDKAVRENLFDPSSVPERWLDPALEIANGGESAWERDRELARVINGCLRGFVSHAHLHGPGAAEAEPADVEIPWVSTDEGVSVLWGVSNDRGDTILPGELILGAANARDMRRSLEGLEGDLASLRVRGLDGSERTVSWSCSAERSEAVTSQMLPGGILHVRIASFSGFGPFDHGNAEIIEGHVRGDRNSGGLILDLRGNPGGGRSATDVAALFHRGVKTLALFVAREDAARDAAQVAVDARKVRTELSWKPWVTIGRLLAYLDVMDGQESFGIQGGGDGSLEGVRVAVLIDEGTRSSAEILAAFLQEECGATLVGRRSGGECAMPANVDLPFGWEAHLPRCYVASGRGTRIEGRGLEPQVHVAHRRSDLAGGRDADVEAARALLEKPRPAASGSSSARDPEGTRDFELR